MAKKNRPFPKELFVTREDEGTDDEFLKTELTAQDHAEAKKVKRVARYELKEILIVDTPVRIVQGK